MPDSEIMMNYLINILKIFRKKVDINVETTFAINIAIY